MTIDKKFRHILTFSALLLLHLSNNLTAQTLTIKIKNNTGHKIDSLIVATKYIGTIEKDSVIGPIQFEKFWFDSGAPYESISGLVSTRRLNNEWWSWCGTSQTVKEDGEFFFELTIRQVGEIEYLLLQKY